MGYFVAYRHTGADPEYLAEFMPAIRDAFAECGTESYCTYFDEGNFKSDDYTKRQIMEHAFSQIEQIGGLFVVIDGPEKSDGQLLEVGFCLAKQIPIIVAKRSSVDNTYIHEMTDRSFEYDTLDELKAGIQQICEADNGTQHN